MQPGDVGAKSKTVVEAMVKMADLSVAAAVQRDLADLARRDSALAESALAATALALARELDGHNSATSKSMCARALGETLERLRELAPEEEKEDALDDLSARRAKRIAGSAGS